MSYESDDEVVFIKTLDRHGDEIDNSNICNEARASPTIGSIKESFQIHHCTKKSCRFMRSHRHGRELNKPKCWNNVPLIEFLDAQRMQVNAKKKPYLLNCLNCLVAQISQKEEEIVPGKNYVNEFVNFGEIMQGYLDSFFLMNS